LSGANLQYHNRMYHHHNVFSDLAIAGLTRRIINPRIKMG
jgi:hypothetical protein